MRSPRPTGALQAASEGQAALAAGPITVRMGLHTGAPHIGKEGYIGGDVHLGARIAAAAHGGQVVLSVQTRELVDGDITDLGEHRLKDIPDAIAIFQLGSERFPPLKTLYRASLPIQPTPFLGRERELAEVVSLLAETRLLTLTGAGGSGKTRLAVQAADMAVGDYRDGVWWVSLAALREPRLVLQTISQVLGAKAELREHIADKELLLVLDNFEQLLDAARELAELLSSCPNLRLLVTSRAPLHVRAELEYAVQPFVDEEAVGFFLARARAVRPQFEPSSAIAEICARLDNLPLALELAAARVKTLSADAILEQLAQRLPFLTGGYRDLPERQQTLRDTIDWSYQLLGGDEQQLFRRLSVFAGGSTPAAAEQVAKADLEALQSLVDKSLLRLTEERFWMLETIREYAAERLDDSTEGESLRGAHAAHYLGWAEDAAPNLRGPTQAEWLSRFDDEYANMRAALAWCVKAHPDRALRLGGALRRYWWARSLLEEADPWLERLLPIARSTVSEAAVSVLVAANALARDRNRIAAAAGLAEEALEVALQLGSAELIAACQHELAIDLLAMGDMRRARDLWEESLFHRRQIGDLVGVTQVLNGLSAVALEEGDTVSGRAYLLEALEVARELGAEESIGGTLINLVALSLEHDGEAIDLQWVVSSLRESFELARKLNHPLFVSACLEEFAAAELLRGNQITSVRMLGAAGRVRDDVGLELPSEEEPRHERLVSALRGAVGRAAFEQAWEEGKAIDLEQMVALAIEGAAEADRDSASERL